MTLKAYKGGKVHTLRLTKDGYLVWGNNRRFNDATYTEEDMMNIIKDELIREGFVGVIFEE